MEAVIGVGSCFLSALGLGISLRSNKKDYTNFKSVIKEIVKDSCADYSNLLKQEHSRIKITKKHKRDLCNVIIKAIDDRREFTIDMVLPSEAALSSAEKKRLFEKINLGLNRSLEYMHLMHIKKEDTMFVELRAFLSETANSPHKTQNFLDKAKNEYYKNKIVTIDAAQHPTEKYVARAEEQEIKNKLTATHKVLLVSGVGGIGKSEICKVLFYHYRESLIPQYLGWLQFHKNFQDTLYSKFNVTKNIEDKDKNIRETKTHINELGNKLLLFVDNVDVISPEDIISFTSLSCNLIMTSRLKEITTRMDRVTIGTLSPEGCVELYKKHCKNASDTDDHIKEVAIKAANHTLAVELLAKTASNSGKTACEMLNEIEINGFCLNNIDKEIELNGEYKTFIEHFSKVFTLAKLDKKKELPILKKLSLMPYQQLKSSLVKKWFELENFKVITSLIRKGWIMESDGDSYIMHPIIAEVVRYKYPSSYSECKKMVSIMADDADIKQNETVNETFIDKLNILPFVCNVSAYFVDDADECLIDLNLAIGRIYKDSSAYETALEFHKKGLRMGETLLHKDDWRIARAHTWIGIVHYKQGKYDVANDCYKETIRICDASPNMDRKERATNINHVGLNYLALAKGEKNIGQQKVYFDNALKYIGESYRIRKDTLGEAHQHTLYPLGNLARVHKEMGKYDLSLKIYAEVFTGNLINSKNKPSLDAGHTMASIADVYEVIGDSETKIADVDKALFYYKMALNDYTEVLIIRQDLLPDKEHIDVGKAYCRLGEIYYKMSDFHSALSMFKKAVPIYKRNGVKNDISEKIEKMQSITVTQNSSH